MNILNTSNHESKHQFRLIVDLVIDLLLFLTR